MQYKYRWYYAVIISAIIILLGIIYYIYPKYKNLLALKQKELFLSNQLATKIITNKRYDLLAKENGPQKKLMGLLRYDSQPTISQHNYVKNLLATTNLHGVNIQSVKIMPSKINSFDVLILHITAEGKFSDFITLIKALGNQAHPTVLKNFIVKSSSDNKQQIVMTIALYTTLVQDKISVLDNTKHLGNPFCCSQHQEQAIATLKHYTTNDILQHVSLNQIKIAGFLQDGQHKQALLRIPHIHAIAVECGMKLGKENGIVTSIQRGFVTIILPNGRHTILSLRH